MNKLLELKGLEVEISTGDGESIFPLQGIDFVVGENEAVGLVGESGSGKSMTLRAILRLLPRGSQRTRGEIILSGNRLDNSEDDIFETVRGREISMIFQDPVSALSPLMSIGDQISDVYRYNMGSTKTEGWERAVNLLKALSIVGPEKVARRFPHQMSGGMAQRINIAMALVCEPKLLLADEPTTGLDVTTQMQVLELLSEQMHQREASLLFVSHDLRVIGKICEKVGVMYGGLLMEFGTTEEIFESPKHPYTERLLECARISENSEPKSIPGSVPKLNQIHKLCPFRNRCHRKMLVCDKEMPPQSRLNDNHLSRCHLN